MAAMAGANSEPATAVRAFSTATMVKPANSGRASEPRVTTTAAVTRIARLAWLRSTSAPAGVCASSPATPPIDMTRPIEASSHFWMVSR